MPEVAESTVSKSEGKPSPWGEGARHGRLGLGKVLFYGPHPPSATAPLTRRARVYCLIMDSATLPCGRAQNDSIAGGIQVSDGTEGSPHSCSCGAVSTHLALPVCAQ